MMPPFTPFSQSAAANRTSYQLSPRAICLPSGYDLVEEDVVFVSQVLKQIIDHAESN
jgi:dTDP-4-amino-4,6-dideoxygalactose transaminase